MGVNDESCYTCGRRFPGMWGFASLLRGGRLEDLYVPTVFWICGALYIAGLAVDPEGIGRGGMLGFLSPSQDSLLRFGATGTYAVVGYGRWWTLLSAGWLHAGALHIVFNMMSIRDLGPLTVQMFGVARTVIIHVLSSVAGFGASVLANWLLGRPTLVVGASAAVFGLMGALLHYSRRSGSSRLGSTVRGWILGGLAFGFFMPGIDNWAHLGGLAGGWLVSYALDPLLPERGNHVIAAAVFLIASLAAIVASVAAGLPGA